MQRRTLLKNIGILSTGMLLYPSCDYSTEEIKEAVGLVLNNLHVSDAQQALLKSVVSTIIPPGETPGALDLEVDNFVWIMVDDCLNKKSQDQYMKGLENFTPYAAQVKNVDFLSLPPENRETFLSETLEEQGPRLVETKATKPNAQTFQPKGSFVVPNNPEAFLAEIKHFIYTTKRYTIQGFLQSKYIMTKVMPYQLVPGTYNLCETIDPSKKVNIHA